MINLQPCHNRVLIQAKLKDSSLVIPDQASVPYDDVYVLAIGPDVKCCKPGDKILLVPNPNVLGIDPKEHIGITTDVSIIAIELDSQTLIS